MTKKHYIPITSDVPGADSKERCALIRKVIRTALAAEGVTAACEVDVLLTDDENIHAINRDMREKPKIWWGLMSFMIISFITS